MALVNTCVISTTTRLHYLNWTILSVDNELYSIQDFFECSVKPRIITANNISSVAACIGPDKQSLDSVDTDLQLVLVIKSFGHFLKYIVDCDPPVVATEIEESVHSSVPHNNTITNSFTFVELIHEKNKKDKLFNDIITFLKSWNVSVKSCELDSARKLITLLCNILWYIDGHHHVFQERATDLPAIFKQFINYNSPHLSKHRKRLTCNISAEQLHEFALDITIILHCDFFDRPEWIEFKDEIISLSESLSSYARYLNQKAKRMNLYHRSPTPIRELSSNLKLKFILPSVVPPPSLHHIDAVLVSKSEYEYESFTHLLPSDSTQKHRFMDQLFSNGLSVPCVILIYTAGGNIGNLVFGWRVPNEMDQSIIFEQSQRVVEEIKLVIPQYHTRAMRSVMFEKFGRISTSVKPAILRYFYKELTGDHTSSITTDEALLDARVHQFIDMEDSDIITDLRSLNTNESSKYDIFWEECKKFLAEDISTAVDDRRHGQITHLARAISVRDFVDQVKSRCPAGTAIPSLEWVRLQFWPKTPSAKVSLHYTGQFKVKFMIQQRQWRHQHPDAHYAAASFRYMREYALMVREHCLFVCLDDKHKIKVGEPGFPVATAERGRRVLVRADEFFTVGDHDFTKFSLIPSVAFIIDIPLQISDSWYSGSVVVGLKDSVFEHSSPFRHMCELYQILQNRQLSKSILFLYTDGGSDHRLTYLSVKLSLICLFLKLDLDYLCAGRTAPYHSWRNPVERIMSVLNLGLQSVGIARVTMPDEFESEVSKCNNLSELRSIASRNTGIKEAVHNSLSPVKALLCSIFVRLKLHENFIECFEAASERELSEFWTAVIAMDATLQEGGQYRKEDLPLHKSLNEFILHCCQSSQYTFDILKCGSAVCNICKPFHLPPEIFHKLRHIPHPTLGEDGHYKPFSDIYGTVTSDACPSFNSNKEKSNSLPFYGTLQHVKNSQLVIQCNECGMWRLIFSKYKLKSQDRQELQLLLDDYTYSCGSQLSELHLPDKFENVEIRRHSCHDIIEKLYYSAKYEPICVYCGTITSFTDNKYYPQCVDCREKPPVRK